MRCHRHGSPADRGSADRYYGRVYRPHYHVWTYESIAGKMELCFREVKIENMTPEQIKEYRNGYDTEEDRKDWG